MSMLSLKTSLIAAGAGLTLREAGQATDDERLDRAGNALLLGSLGLVGGRAVGRPVGRAAGTVAGAPFLLVGAIPGAWAGARLGALAGGAAGATLGVGYGVSHLDM